MPRIQMGFSLQFYHILFQYYVPIFNEKVYENAEIKMSQVKNAGQ